MSQLTKRAIIASFTKLLNSKPLDKITVKDIVEDCGINRNTFYYHFRDIKDLTLYLLNLQAEGVMKNNTCTDTWVESFIESARFALENKRAIYHIYKSVSREALEDYLNAVAYEAMKRFIDHAAEGKKIKELDKTLLIEFYKSALVGMVCTWLERGMEDNPEEKIRRLGRLLDGAIAEALRISTEN